MTIIDGDHEWPRLPRRPLQSLVVVPGVFFVPNKENTISGKYNQKNMGASILFVGQDVDIGTPRVSEIYSLNIVNVL